MPRRFFSLAAVAALAAVAPAADAGFPGHNGRIVYATAGTDAKQGGSESYQELRTIDADKERNRLVAVCGRIDGSPAGGNCEVSYRSPVWSPDGRRLAFDAGSSLALIGPDGADLEVLRAVSEDDGEPAFSPSGAQLVFTAKTGARTGISVVGTDGAGARSIVKDGASPDWSRSGLIAFARGGVIYSVKPSGKELRKLTSGRDPSWSPSGRQIAFARRGGIYVAGAGGKHARRVVRCSSCKTPAFSPDGESLVYDGGGLFVVRVSDGKRLSKLVEDVPGSFDGRDPDWRPR